MYKKKKSFSLGSVVDNITWLMDNNGRGPELAQQFNIMWNKTEQNKAYAMLSM